MPHQQLAMEPGAVHALQIAAFTRRLRDKRTIVFRGEPRSDLLDQRDLAVR
jgi:hypothetical protein